MFVLTSPHTGIIAADTLEEIRNTVLERDYAYRAGYLESYLDQVDALWPRDESELDDDEEPTVPRALTVELLTDMLQDMYNEPRRKNIAVKKLDAPTVDDLAAAVALGLGVPTASALAIVSEVAAALGVDAHRALEPATFHRLLDGVKAASDDVDAIGGQFLTPLTRQYQAARREVESARLMRNAAIRLARIKGLEQAEIAHAMDMTQQAVSKVLNS